MLLLLLPLFSLLLLMHNSTLVLLIHITLHAHFLFSFYSNKNKNSNYNWLKNWIPRPNPNNKNVNSPLFTTTHELSQCLTTSTLNNFFLSQLICVQIHSFIHQFLCHGRWWDMHHQSKPWTWNNGGASCAKEGETQSPFLGPNVSALS